MILLDLQDPLEDLHKTILQHLLLAIEIFSGVLCELAETLRAVAVFDYPREECCLGGQGFQVPLGDHQVWKDSLDGLLDLVELREEAAVELLDLLIRGRGLLQNRTEYSYFLLAFPVPK